MAEGKNSILIYTDWIDTFEYLTDEEAGKLVKHLFRYVNDKNPIAPDRLTEISFIPIKNSLKRDLKKWELELERKSDGGRLGNLKRWHLDLYELVIKKEITIEKAEEIGKGRIKSHTDTERKNISLPIASVADSVLVPVSVPDSDSVKEKLEKRKTAFGYSLKEFEGSYTKEMLTAFFRYWTEKNKSGTKMKWELEKTFEISLRLTTWASRDKTFNSSQPQNFTPSPPKKQMTNEERRRA